MKKMFSTIHLVELNSQNPYEHRVYSKIIIAF